MKRKLLEKLLEWEKNTDKAFYLFGAPGVGKTYLALEYAKTNKHEYFYLNPQNDYKLRTEMLSWFKNENADIKTFLMNYFSIPEDWIHQFLFIFDNMDCCEEIKKTAEKICSNHNGILTLLILRTKPSEYFTKNCICANLFPMEFDEFLSAIGSEWYTEIIRGHFIKNKKIPEIVHKEMNTLFKDYIRIGGMPDAVSEYVRSESLYNIASVQRRYNRFLEAEVSGYEDGKSIRMKQILESIPEQLIKTNKNFQFNLIRKGATYNIYKDSLEQLIQLNMVNKIDRADIFETGSEFDFVRDFEFVIHDNHFRLYFSDCGNLRQALNSRHQSLTPENLSETEEEMTGNDDWTNILIENYMLQILKAREYPYTFWESGSLSKIDFILKAEEGIVPVEIKTNGNTRAKSLSVFKNRYKIPYAIRISMNNFEFSNQVRNIPCYSLFCL